MSESFSPVRLDPRLRMVMLCLVPGLVGHTIQLASEDTPWTSQAWARYYTTPGWHLFVSPWLPILIACVLAIAVLGMGFTAALDVPCRGFFQVKSPRFWFATVGVFYAAHYLTYPYRIRNHMSFMLASLGAVLLLWSVTAWREKRFEPVYADAWAMRAVAAIVCVMYFFAGLHKMNTTFIDSAVNANGDAHSRSSAVDGLGTFWIHGGFAGAPPKIARVTAVWGTIVIEMLVPFLAWRSERLRSLFVGILIAFHVPHVTSMDVADYPMIASSFWPALFSLTHAERVRMYLKPRWWNVSGALCGVLIQLWFVPNWTKLHMFGIFVLGLWGWALASLCALEFLGRRK